MSGKRISEMTDAEIREMATGAPTYNSATMDYTGTIRARERYEALDLRYHLARAHAKLEAGGEYDPATHGAPTGPLTATEHLERLALGEYLSRHYRPNCELDAALRAGVSLAQVAAALDCTEDAARERIRAWAAGQHRLHGDLGGIFGLDDDAYAAVLGRVDGAR